jgi:phosphoribosylformylglycinamidine synthase
MAMVVAPGDAAAFIDGVLAENLEYSISGLVTRSGRLRIKWRGDFIFDVSRDFIATNGALRHASAHISAPAAALDESASAPSGLAGFRARLLRAAGELNSAGQKGLVEMFDSSIGAGSMFAPYGGRLALTPAPVAACLIPTPLGPSPSRATVVSHGYDPCEAARDEHRGAYYSVLSSVAKLVCAGVGMGRIKLSFQEYFAKPGDDPAKWAGPLRAMLGAFRAQRLLGVYAVGGKDSMSGSFEDLSVPGTLISFAFADESAHRLTSNVLKDPGSRLIALHARRDEYGLADAEDFACMMRAVEAAIGEGIVQAACATGFGGIAHTAVEMALGNGLGINFAGSGIALEGLFEKDYASAVVAALPGNERRLDELLSQWACFLGTTDSSGEYAFSDSSDASCAPEKESVSMKEFLERYEGAL